MTTTEWHNVAGEISVEVYVYNEMKLGLIHSNVFDADKDEPAPASVLPYVRRCGNWAELVLEFQSSGFHTPASMYGGPDRMGWAEEGEDERSMLRVYINEPEAPRLPVEVQTEVFEFYRNRIEDAELEARG